MTRHKCDGCFYKTDWEVVTHKFPICEREWWGSFEHCKAECAKPGPCPYYITHEEINRIADVMNDILLN